MYAIAFDMEIADLHEHYGKPYNNAYYEIGKVLQRYGFYNAQGSVYLNLVLTCLPFTRRLMR